MDLDQVMQCITTRQRIELTVTIGRGCRDVVVCSDGGVVCVMPDKSVIVIPRNKFRAPRLRRLWLFAGAAAGVYGLLASTFTGYLGPSHVIYAAAYVGLYLGITTEWPRTVKRQHDPLRALMAIAAAVGVHELHEAGKQLDEHHSHTRGMGGSS